MDVDEEESSMLLVSVAAESLQTGKPGVLIIQKHHDTSFSVIFCSIGEMEMTDIDCVSVDVKERRVLFNDFVYSMSTTHNSSLPSQQTTSLTFSIPDRVHLQHFVDAQAECQRVCNMFLELRSRFIDIYCGAVYTELGVLMQSSSCLSGPIPEELSKLQLQSLRKLDADIMNGGSVGENEENMTFNQQYTVSLANSNSHRNHVNTATKACCFYCQATPKDGELFNHPYVPLSFDKSRVLMCNVCLNNWKDYRDAAHRDLHLILPGEINEEICALCSDTPETLVLCNMCPRSFCDTCLRHVLGYSATDRILHSHNDVLWKCMSCANRVSAQPLLSRDVWVSWKKIQSEPQHNASNSVNSSNNNTNKSNSNFHDNGRSKDTYSGLADVSAVGASSIGSRQKLKRSAAVSSLNRNGGVAEVSSSSENKSKQLKNINKYTSSSANNKAKKAKPSLSKSVSLSSNNSTSFATSESATDEVFYFAQYLDFLERKCTMAVEKFKKQKLRAINNNNSSNNTNSNNTGNSYMRGKRKQRDISQNNNSNDSNNEEEEDETDDACFLCKDGGEVIECDFSRRLHCLSVRGSGSGDQGGVGGSVTEVVQRTLQQCRCRKVYHSYCLNYEVTEEVQRWCCPRHFCSHCGRTDTLHYLCGFCPLSLCKTCAPLYAGGGANQGDAAQLIEEVGGAKKALQDNRHYYFTLPNLTPTTQMGVDLAEEEVYKGVTSQWMAPYRFPGVTLIACDTCATHCLKLQRDTPGDTSKYFYTLLGEKCFFDDVSHDTLIEETSATQQDAPNNIADDQAHSINKTIYDINNNNNIHNNTINDISNNDNAIKSVHEINNNDNDNNNIKTHIESLVSPPLPLQQVMCVSDDEDI